MKGSPLFSAVTWGLVLLSAQVSLAAVITFEQDPAGATPVDDAALATAYNLVGGGTVEFYFDANTNLSFNAGIDFRGLFEASGADVNEGFVNSVTTIPDTANGGLGSQLGSWFVRQPVAGKIPPPFVIDYNTSQTITALSGEIWDIDGTALETEQWRVDALDGANKIMAMQFSPLGNSAALDGLPWTFSFSGLPSSVDKVVVRFVGSKQGGLGLAFNNFSPTSVVPEPSGLVLMAMGIAACGLVAIRRRRLGGPERR